MLMNDSILIDGDTNRKALGVECLAQRALLVACVMVESAVVLDPIRFDDRGGNMVVFAFALITVQAGCCRCFDS